MMTDKSIICLFCIALSTTFTGESTASVDPFLVTGSKAVTIEPKAAAKIEVKQLAPPPATTDGKAGYVVSKLKDVVIGRITKFFQAPPGNIIVQRLEEGTYECEGGTCTQTDTKQIDSDQYKMARSGVKQLKNLAETIRIKRGNALTRIAYRGPPYTKPPKPLPRIRTFKMDGFYEEKEEKQAQKTHHDADDKLETLVF